MIIIKCAKEILSINIFLTLSIYDLPLIFFMTDDRYKMNVSKNNYFLDIIIDVSKCEMIKFR